MDDLSGGCLVSIIMIVVGLLLVEFVFEPYDEYKRNLYVVYTSDDVLLKVSNDKYQAYQIFFYNDEGEQYFSTTTYYLGFNKKQAYTELRKICSHIGDTENGIYTDDCQDTVTWNRTTVFFKDNLDEQGWMKRDELDDMCDALACYDYEKTKQPKIISLSIWCGILALIIGFIIASKLGLFRWLRERNRHHY